MNLKFRRFMFLSSLFLLGILFECDGYGSGENLTPNAPSSVHTENDFAADPNLRIPILQTAVTFLEPPNTVNNVDTYESGVDTIPYYFEESAEYRFCWEGGIDGSQHYMYLQDETGNEILKVFSGGECVTATIGTGNYTMFFVHDRLTTDVQPIFIVANSGKSDQGIQQKGNRPVSLLLSNRSRGAPDLTSADLNNSNLSRAYLNGAYLNEAILRNADLRLADLSGADLSGADLTQADLRRAELGGAKLSFVNLSGADLARANLDRAYLFEVNLKGANLRGAHLRGAYLEGANLSGTTWTNGRVCAEGSKGRCN